MKVLDFYLGYVYVVYLITQQKTILSLLKNGPAIL